MKRALPPGQTRILTLYARAEQEGRQPSRAEIAEQLSYAFPSAVTKHVEALARKGYMSIDRDKKRNARLTPAGWTIIGLTPRNQTASVQPQRAGVPVLGHIAAGTPIEAIEEVDSVLRDLAPLPGRFALRVRGDSMIEAGIQDGDFAVIQQGAPVASGGIGAVVVSGESTLKRVHRREDGIELVPANADYAPRFIPADEAGEVHVVGPLLFIYRPVK